MFIDPNEKRPRDPIGKTYNSGSAPAPLREAGTPDDYDDALRYALLLIEQERSMLVRLRGTADQIVKLDARRDALERLRAPSSPAAEPETPYAVSFTIGGAGILCDTTDEYAPVARFSSAGEAVRFSEWLKRLLAAVRSHPAADAPGGETPRFDAVPIWDALCDAGAADSRKPYTTVTIGDICEAIERLAARSGETP